MVLRPFHRPLGDTGLTVSPLGLGTVKFGRNRDVKYPDPFALPSDADVRKLLDVAQGLGVNLLDTAPAYGASETRIGELIERREDWILCTKAGESWDERGSTFDFSGSAIRASVHRSLERLRTEFIDVVMIHSSGADEAILRGDAVSTLMDLKREGLIRAVGMSTKPPEGTHLAAETCDVLMTTYSPDEPEVREAATAAAGRGRGLLVKKALQSGHWLGPDVLTEPLKGTSVSSVVVGTINPEHLRANAELVASALGPRTAETPS